MTDRSIGFSWKLSNVSTDNINDIDQGIAGGSLRDGVAVRGFTREGAHAVGRVAPQGRTGPEAPNGRHLKSLPHKPLPSHKLPSITKTRAEHDKRTRRGAQIISKKSYFTYPLVTFRTRSG